MSPRNTVARVLERLVVVLSVVILLMSVMSVISTITIQREVRETTRTISPLNEQSGRLRITLANAQSSYRAYLLTRESTFRDEYLAARSDFQEGTQVLLDRVAAAGMDDQKASEFIAASNRWFRVAEIQIASPRGASLSRSRPAYTRVERTHDALVKEITDVRQERRDRYNLYMNGAIALMGLATLIALFVTVSQARRALNRLARPLQALHQVVLGHERGSTLERADVANGADEVVALANAFNTLAESHTTMQRERERRLDLYRVTGEVPGVLTTREGGWDRACERLGEGLGVDAVSVYRLVGDETVSLLGSWHSSGADFPPVLRDVGIPGLARMLNDIPILRAAKATEVVQTFPPELQRLAEEQSLEGWVLHPMRLGDEAVGVLSVASLHEHVWDEAEVQAMERVAEYAAHTLVEQRYVTSLEELDEQKSVFMSTTSHELRTPLTSIAGYLELLEDGDYGPLTGAQTQALGVVARNVERLRSLIDDLLLLNRLDSGQANTHSHVLDIRRSIARVAEQLGPVAAAAEVELVTDQWGEPVLVDADTAQIERAIGNVVSNAVKFTPAGGSVRLTSRVEGQEAHLVCADTGMGVPEADRARLFTRFFRATNAQEGQVPGTGLGLVIVRTIAESHGGYVNLTSVEGEGTTVTLVLPLAASAPASPAVPQLSR